MPRKEREFEVEDASRRLAKHQSGGSIALALPNGMPFWKPKQSGSHTIDVIPYVVTDKIKRYPDQLRFSSPGKWYFERTYFSHRKIGVNEDTYVCLAKTFGKPCPVCEARGDFNQNPDPDSQKAAKNLKPSERQLFLIYDHDEPKKWIQLWDVSNWNFGKGLDFKIENSPPKEKDARRSFYHPTKGRTLYLTVAEETLPGGKNYKYIVDQFMTRDEPLPDELLDHGIDLDAIPRQVEYDALKKIYLGIGDEEDDDENGSDASAEEPTTRPRIAPETSQRNGSHREEEETPTPRRKPEPEPEKPAPAKPKPTAAAKEDEPTTFATGDEVSFDRRGQEVTGIVKKVDFDREIAQVEAEGFDRLITVDFRDLKLIKADDTFDLKDKGTDDEPPAKTAAKGKWGDDDEPAAAEPVKRGPGRPPKNPK